MPFYCVARGCSLCDSYRDRVEDNVQGQHSGSDPERRVDFSDLVKIPGSCCNNPKVGRGETSVPGSPHSCLAPATSSFGPSSARNVFSAGLQDSTQG
jgi:hypothetical protein